MAELADALDSKSSMGDYVWVRVPPTALYYSIQIFFKTKNNLHNMILKFILVFILINSNHSFLISISSLYLILKTSIILKDNSK